MQTRLIRHLLTHAANYTCYPGSIGRQPPMTKSVHCQDQPGCPAVAARVCDDTPGCTGFGLCPIYHNGTVAELFDDTPGDFQPNAYWTTWHKRGAPVPPVSWCAWIWRWVSCARTACSLTPPLRTWPHSCPAHLLVVALALHTCPTCRSHLNSSQWRTGTPDPALPRRVPPVQHDRAGAAACAAKRDSGGAEHNS